MESHTSLPDIDRAGFVALDPVKLVLIQADIDLIDIANLGKDLFRGDLACAQRRPEQRLTTGIQQTQPEGMRKPRNPPFRLFTP